MPTERRPQAVTSAPRSRREDRDARMRAYLIAMSIRIASFPLSVWALMSGYIVLGCILATAAILLPSFAVTSDVTPKSTSGNEKRCFAASLLPDFDSDDDD